MAQKLKKFLPWALIALALGFSVYLFKLRLDSSVRPAGAEDPVARVRGPNNLRIDLVGTRGADLISLAYESGLFENEGLLIDPVTVSTTGRALHDLARQEVDLAVVSDVPLGLVSSTATDIGVLAIVAEGRQDMLVITPKEDGVAALDEIEGARLGIDDQEVGRYALDLFLARHGLSEADVTVVPLKLKDLPAALRRGDVAAIADAFVDRHHPLQGLTKPTERQMTTLTDPDLLLLQYCLVAPRGIIQKKRPLILKTLRALLAASDAMKSDPVGSAKFVAKGEHGATLKVAQRWTRYEFGVTLGPKLLSSLEAQGRWTRRYNQDAGTPDWASMMAPELLAELRPEAVTLGK